MRTTSLILIAFLALSMVPGIAGAQNTSNEQVLFFQRHLPERYHKNARLVKEIQATERSDFDISRKVKNRYGGLTQYVLWREDENLQQRLARQLSEGRYAVVLYSPNVTMYQESYRTRSCTANSVGTGAVGALAGWLTGFVVFPDEVCEHCTGPSDDDLGRGAMVGAAVGGIGYLGYCLVRHTRYYGEYELQQRAIVYQLSD